MWDLDWTRERFRDFWFCCWIFSCLSHFVWFLEDSHIMWHMQVVPNGFMFWSLFVLPFVTFTVDSYLVFSDKIKFHVFGVLLLQRLYSLIVDITAFIICCYTGFSAKSVILISLSSLLMLPFLAVGLQRCCCITVSVWSCCFFGFWRNWIRLMTVISHRVNVLISYQDFSVSATSCRLLVQRNVHSMFCGFVMPWVRLVL